MAFDLYAQSLGGMLDYITTKLVKKICQLNLRLGGMLDYITTKQRCEQATRDKVWEVC